MCDHGFGAAGSIAPQTPGIRRKLNIRAFAGPGGSLSKLRMWEIMPQPPISTVV